MQHTIDNQVHLKFEPNSLHVSTRPLDTHSFIQHSHLLAHTGRNTGTHHSTHTPAHISALSLSVWLFLLSTNEGQQAPRSSSSSGGRGARVLTTRGVVRHLHQRALLRRRLELRRLSAPRSASMLEQLAQL